MELQNFYNVLFFNNWYLNLTFLGFFLFIVSFLLVSYNSLFLDPNNNNSGNNMGDITKNHPPIENVVVVGVVIIVVMGLYIVYSLSPDPTPPPRGIHGPDFQNLDSFLLNFQQLLADLNIPNIDFTEYWRLFKQIYEFENSFELLSQNGKYDHILIDNINISSNLPIQFQDRISLFKFLMQKLAENKIN